MKSQQFTSTTDIMNSLKELFSDVLQTVMKAALEEKLGYEKSERTSDNAEKLPKRILEKDSKNATWRG